MTDELDEVVRAVRRAAATIDVPGTPRALRLDDVEVHGAQLVLTTSFPDPEDEELGLLERLTFPLEPGDRAEQARGWWGAAQLAAAHRHKLQVDSDILPGQPYVRRDWTPPEAWAALVDFLGAHGDEVHAERGLVRVRERDGTESTYAIDPDEWAAYLTEPEASGDGDLVPSAVPMQDGLPLWATDDLQEANGAWGPDVGLVDGELVGLGDRDADLGLGLSATGTWQLFPTYDVAALRAHLPQLTDGAAHFDGPGGTQTPDVVAQAMYDVLTGPLANRGTTTAAERNAEVTVVAARSAMADLLGADPRGIVFGRSMTQLTLDLARTMAKDWSPGDEIVVTRLDHDANVRGWVLAAEAVGATVRFADLDPATAELDPAQVAEVLSPATRLVAVTAASNLLGTIPDLPAVAGLVHDVNALLFVDAVHRTAHTPVDLHELGADFLACSPYKFLGPHCGVLAADPALLETLRPDKLLPSTDAVPERFELGTLPYELLAGTTAAVDLLAGLAPGLGETRRERLLASMTAVEAHEDRLRLRIEDALAAWPEVTVHSRAARRTPTLLVTVEGHDVRAISAFLAERGVNAPAGTFYAYEPARRLGLGPSGGLRIGLAPYTDDADVGRLLDALGACLAR